MRCWTIWGLVVSTILLSSFTYAATYGGGSGTPDDPYQIWTPEQMNTIGANFADWDKHFELMADIDMSAYAGTKYNIIGIDSHGPFTGMFEGNGHVIHNFNYTTTETTYYVGIFGYITEATIQNLGVENISISNVGNFVGGLVGYNSAGTITSCYTTGSNCGTGDYVGGLVGRNSSGHITSCYTTVTVSGSSEIGGLVGENNYGHITSCYAAGQVSGSSAIGGLVGANNWGSITFSFWDTQTSGQTISAGGTGKTTNEMQISSTYIDAGWDFVGESENGLHDYWQMNINEYPRLVLASWTLKGEGTSVDPYIVANSVDLAKVWLRPSAWYRLESNLDLNGISWSTAVIPLFKGNFEGQGYIISHLTINRKGNNYVSLFGRTFGAMIQNLGVEDVNIAGYDNIGGLTGDSFHGTIRSCYSTGLVTGHYEVGGLAGENESSSIELCHSSAEVRGERSIGGLAGYSWMGGIVSCYATGLVNSSASNSGNVGGLVGMSWMSSIISCYATGLVSSSATSGDVGGLIGFDRSGTIMFCYAAGFVKCSSSNSGGLIGHRETDGVAVCFWDIQNSSQSNGVGYGASIGVTGCTTAKMKTLSTFIDAKWDFTNESINGTNDYWRMCADGAIDYPRLNWESIKGDIACSNGVGMEDLGYLLQQWLMIECDLSNNFCGGADINNSGIVDLPDFAVLAEHWLEEGYIAPALPSPIVMWKMDETEGTVVADSIGEHEGQTVNIEGNPWQAGHHDYALKLDGVDGYVEAVDFKGITGTASRTCSAWIKATVNNKEQAILSWGNAASGQKWLFRTQTDGKLAVGVWGGYIYGNVSVADGQWHHVAAVLVDDGAPSINEVKLYVDGVPQTVTYNTTQAIDTVSGQDVQIGSVYNGTSQVSFFNGLLDDVRIYNLSLDANQIYRLSME